MFCILIFSGKEPSDGVWLKVRTQYKNFNVKRCGFRLTRYKNILSEKVSGIYIYIGFEGNGEEGNKGLEIQ